MISNVLCFRALPQCYRIAFPIQDNTAVRSQNDVGLELLDMFGVALPGILNNEISMLLNLSVDIRNC